MLVAADAIRGARVFNTYCAVYCSARVGPDQDRDEQGGGPPERIVIHVFHMYYTCITHVLDCDTCITICSGVDTCSKLVSGWFQTLQGGFRHLDRVVGLAAFVIQIIRT